MTTKPQAQPAEAVELKPCPLCGSTDLFLRDIAGWELDCRVCELSLVLADDPSREGLIARWNTRADLPRAAADDNALKKRVRQIIDAVFASACVVETRCFSQPGEVERLENQIAALLSPRAEGLSVEAAKEIK